MTCFPEPDHMSSRRSSIQEKSLLSNLQSRNFGSNKSFLANPKIKIIATELKNTLVALILPYQPPKKANSKKLIFFVQLGSNR